MSLQPLFSIAEIFETPDDQVVEPLCPCGSSFHGEAECPDNTDLLAGVDWAALDEIEVWDATSERDKLRVLGAPPWMWEDLSDAAHNCVSGDDGLCVQCKAGDVLS